jgi:hypothetical protein
VTYVRRVLVACVVAAACGGKLDRKQLSGQVQQLHGYAAEAHELWIQRDAGDTPRAYARVQRDQLVDKIHDVVEKLGDGVDDPALDPPLRSAQLLGTALESAARVGRGDLGELEARLAVLDERLRP